MKKTKKTCILLLSFLLLLTAATPAIARIIGQPYESGYYYRTDNGDTLTVLWFYGWCEKETYVPKTVAGIPLTPENLDGYTFWPHYRSFRVDDDNEYFRVIDGALFSKNGKTLISAPESYFTGLYLIPEGTQTVGYYSLCTYEACVYFPASVTDIDPDCNMKYDAVVAGYPGSAAETFAAENDLRFIEMGEGHTHCYFRNDQPATCVDGGVVTVVCPCGAVAYEAFSEADPDAHRFELGVDAKTNSVTTKCIYCGVGDNDVNCTCRCHKLDKSVVPTFRNGAADTLSNLIFRIKLLFWRLTGTHRICECGARHY